MDIDSLRLAGLVAYLCEGTKLRRDSRYKNTYHYVIEFTNSDPNLIKLFVDFMRQELDINEAKVKCQVAVYDDLKINETELFWSKITKIPLKNFNKTIIFKPKNLKNKLNLQGTCKVRYHDKQTFLRLNEMITSYIGKGSSLIK